MLFRSENIGRFICVDKLSIHLLLRKEERPELRSMTVQPNLSFEIIESIMGFALDVYRNIYALQHSTMFLLMMALPTEIV
jgi:hypothetical protein